MKETRKELQAMEQETMALLRDVRRKIREQYPWFVVRQIAWDLFYMVGFVLLSAIVGAVTGWWDPNYWVGPIVALYVYQSLGRL